LLKILPGRIDLNYSFLRGDGVSMGTFPELFDRVVEASLRRLPPVRGPERGVFVREIEGDQGRGRAGG
jgi:hypothetical protein